MTSRHRANQSYMYSDSQKRRFSSSYAKGNGICQNILFEGRCQTIYKGIYLSGKMSIDIVTAMSGDIVTAVRFRSTLKSTWKSFLTTNN